MTKRSIHILLAALVLLASASCHRRPLEDPSEVVRIRIDVNVRAVTNVNTNIRNSVHIYGTTASLWEDKIKQLYPELMRVLVYDPDTDKLLAQSFIANREINEEGETVFTGNLGISHGNYNFLVYTSSGFLPNAPLRYMRTKVLGTKADDIEDEYAGISIRYEPEHLMVGNERDVRISPHDTMVVIHTEASTVIDTYYLQVRVRGLQFASTATAVISGLSPSNHIGFNERTVDPSAAVVFEMKKGYDDELDGDNKNILCAVFNTFGKIKQTTSDLYVTFNVYDTAGNLLQYRANLDSVFDSELARKYHWLIIDDDLLVIDIPDPGQNQQSGNGGFQPRVDDWEEEIGEIVL